MLSASDIDVLSSIEFQSANLWDFFIFKDPSPTDILSAIASTSQDAYLKFKCTSVSVPMPTLDTEASLGGHKYYAKRTHVDKVTASFYEDVLFGTFNYFSNWMNEIYDFNLERFKSHQEGTSRSGYVIYYSNNLSIPTAYYYFEGLKINSIGEIKADRTNSAPLVFDVNFSVTKTVYRNTLTALSQVIK
jgi:hypothetical protein